MAQTAAPIVTFYSFKGGVGRSMALANVAVLLASKYHRRVLTIDWDLEAPGLHRFFDVSQRNVGAGLIDLLGDYKNLLRKEVKTLPKVLVEIKDYIRSIPLGTSRGFVSMLPAGRQDDGYAKQVNEFNWEEFYAKWHGFGFMEYFKEQLKANANADIVLIDSRTGITDIGGICTMQLPDVVVLLFALNEQNIDGIEKIVKGIVNQSTATTDRKTPPKLILRPSRVERYLERDKKALWEKAAADRLVEFLPPEDRDRGRSSVTGQAQETDKAVRFMKKKSIPYIGAYGFGETPLAADIEPDGELCEAFEDLSCSILKEAGLWTKGDAAIRGVHETEDTPYYEVELEPEPSFIVKAMSEVSRRVFSTEGLLSVITILLTYLGAMLWPRSSVLQSPDSIAYLFSKPVHLSLDVRLLLWAAILGALGNCLRLFIDRIVTFGMRRGTEPAPVFLFFQPLFSGMLAVLFFSVGRTTHLLVWPPTSAITTAAISFTIGYIAWPVIGKLIQLYLPRA